MKKTKSIMAVSLTFELNVLIVNTKTSSKPKYTVLTLKTSEDRFTTEFLEHLCSAY